MLFELKSSPYKDPIKLLHSDGDKILYRRRLRYRPRNGDDYHTVVEGDSLLSIAFKKYGNDKYYWVIMEVNDILNPFVLEVGKNLLIPKLIDVGL